MKLKFASAFVLATWFLAGCQVSTPSPSDEIDAYSLEVNQCVGSIPSQAATRLKLKPCDAKHEWEAYAATVATHAEKPGSATLAQEAGRYCETAFADFIGVTLSKSQYQMTFLMPSDDTWDLGDRNIICLAGLASGGIIGSLDGVAK
ncbi:MAG: septum formation family protein [Propionibacteriaceae bacterium]|nr:septum formation family protein [Propionibacteriaceae bacterium]